MPQRLGRVLAPNGLWDVVLSGVRLARTVLPPRLFECGRCTVALSLVPLLLAALLGVHAAYTFFSLSLRRLRYPFDLEWMEGGMLGHALRVLEGKPLYPEPSPEFVPFIYGPLYSYAGALSAAIFGPGLFSLRLVSFVSTLIVLAFLYRIVAFETGSRAFGLAAPCLFLATFDRSGGWFDLARVDSFAIAWLLLAIDGTRRAGKTWHFVAAGACLACAALSKQTMAIVYPALAWSVFATGRFRALVPFTGTCAAIGGAFGLFELVRSDGWFWYYAVELPLSHGSKGREDLVTEFWRSELGAALPMASALALLSVMLLPRLPRPRAFAFHGSVGLSLLFASYASRLHMGSWLNDLMPAHVALALMMPLALFALGRECEGRARLAWYAAVGLALAGQLAMLSYAPREHLPKRGSRREGFSLVEQLRREAGDVLVINHPHLAMLAGKPTYAHHMAMIDIFETEGDPRGARKLLQNRWRRLFEERRFSKVILTDDWCVFKPELDAHYKRVADLPLAGDVLSPVTGADIKPRRVYVPK